MDEPEIPWARFEGAVYDRTRQLWRLKGRGFQTATVKQRASSLGKAVHAIFESWHKGAADVNWRDFPGKVALSGAHLIPHPIAVHWARTESSIGRTPLIGLPPHKPQTALVVHGIAWAGFKDLICLPTHAECARLGLPVGRVVLSDYKSTASVERYALTPEELFDDVQANLYALDVREEFSLDGPTLPANWAYFETKEKRQAKATITQLDYDHALEVLYPCAELARRLDTLTSPEDAEQRPEACSDYGPPGKINCVYHKANGGHCEPKKRSMGALISAHLRKHKERAPMALSEKAKADLERIKAERAAKAAGASAATSAPAKQPDPEPEQADAAEGEYVGEDSGDPATADATPAKQPEPVKPAASPAPKAAKVKADGSAAGTILELSADLAKAKLKADAATAEVAALVAKIKAAAS